MPEAAQGHFAEQVRMLPGLLQSIAPDKAQLQRRGAAELGLDPTVLLERLDRKVRAIMDADAIEAA